MFRTCVIAVSLLFVTESCLGAQEENSPRPNILFIFVDDLSWADLACYGHAWHQTPNLDRLASEGMRFTQAYAPAPICSASRASIHTGKTPARLGFEFVTKDNAGQQKHLPGQALRAPPYTLNLPLSEQTIAERIAKAGYETAFFGKWHLNAHHQGYLGWSPTHGPRNQGFAVAHEDFGSHPYSYKKSQPVEPITTPNQFPADTLTEHAIEFVTGEHAKPYFAFVSHFYVHTPVKTPCALLEEKYAKRIPADVPNRKQRIAYAAFLETLDHYIGQLVDAVDAAGEKERTLIVFTSDNGGHPIYATNGPLRGSKWHLYEAGIRVPMIVRMPGQVPAGATCDVPVVGYDLLPTFLAFAGVQEFDRSELDGQDLRPLFLAQQASQDRPIYWHFPYYHPEAGFARAPASIGVDDFAISQTRPQSAIRLGQHKLLYFHEDEHYELYNLANDASESRDLAAEFPALATKLRDQLLTYLTTVGARMPERADVTDTAGEL